MIQRIQTIYLVIAIICSVGLTFVFNLWTISGNEVYTFNMLSNQNIIDKVVPVLFLFSALLSIISIFLFKKRNLQLVLGRINVLINLLLLGLLVYLSQTLSGEKIISEKGIGMLLPLVVILLVFLANKAISKDENLVKSVDRLR